MPVRDAGDGKKETSINLKPANGWNSVAEVPLLSWFAETALLQLDSEVIIVDRVAPRSGGVD